MLRVPLCVEGIACLFTVIPAKAAGMVIVVPFLIWQWRLGSSGPAPPKSRTNGRSMSGGR